MNFIKVCALAEEFEKKAIEREIKKLAKKKKKGKQWKKMPKGWKAKSRKSYYNSLVGDDAEHPVTKCMEKMEDHIDNPGAFCASLKDRVKGKGWRKKKKKKKKK